MGGRRFCFPGALAWGSQRYKNNVRSSGIPMPESVEDSCLLPL